MLWPGNPLHDLGCPLILGWSQFANGGYCSVIYGFTIWRSPPQILNKLIHLSIVAQDFWTINNQKQSIGASSFSIFIFMWYCAALTPMHKKLNKSNIVITLSHVHMLNFYFTSAPAKHFRQYWVLKTCVHSFHLCLLFSTMRKPTQQIFVRINFTHLSHQIYSTSIIHHALLSYIGWYEHVPSWSHPMFQKRSSEWSAQG